MANQPFKESPLFGRQWRITVKNQNGSTRFVIPDPLKPNEAQLRVQFEVTNAFIQVPWAAEITIWNLTEETDYILRSDLGYKVIIEAGYESDGTQFGNVFESLNAIQYGKIFEGNIFQSMFDRENVTDFKTTLWCIDGLGIFYPNFANFTMAAGYDQQDIVNQMARKAYYPIPIGQITPNLKKTKMPRGKVFFGDPKDYLRNLVEDVGAGKASFWVADGQLHVGDISDNSYQPWALELTPENGLVGTPQLIEDGISFRTLLNPNLKVMVPPFVVKINNSIIRQMKAIPGQPITPLDRDGEYKIISVKHRGDTRGNEWYTDCIGVSLQYPVYGAPAQ